MASLAAAGAMELRQSRLMPRFVLLAAVFGAAELALEWIPQYLFTNLSINSQGPAVIALYDFLDASLRVALVPFALFVAFYFLASRDQVDLRRSFFSVALSIFVGTVIVFLPVGVGRMLSGPPPPGFTDAEAVIQSIGSSLGSSLNHAFIGFSAVFLWQFIHRPPGTQSYLESKGKLHGLEDLSIVGVVLIGIYVWEYLARAYDALYPLGAANQVATFFASLLDAGSHDFYTVAIWQQVLLLLVLPFILFFVIARQQRLNPYVQGRRIAVIFFVWGLFLRTVPPYFYVYFARLFDPNAFPSATLGSTFADELVLTNLMGIVASTFTFLFLGITAVVLAFYSQKETQVQKQAQDAL